MNLSSQCPHCQQAINGPANVELICPHCQGGVVLSAAASAAPAVLPKLGCAETLVVIVVLSVVWALVSSWWQGDKPAPATSYANARTTPPPVGPIWIKRGEEVYTRLKNEGQTNGMATVDFKAAGISCSLVLVKGTWRTLTSADQDSLAALLADYAKGKPWRLFDGGDVMRSSAGM